MNNIIADLSRGGVTDLVYTVTHDEHTGKTGYIDGDGNSVSQEQYDAQVAAHAAQDQIQKLKQKDDGPAGKSTKKAATQKTLASATTMQLALPPQPQSRATMTVPMSAMAATSFADTIIDAGVSMMRATDDKDWPTRAANWVALAESRPQLEYK